jgi:hypothetical protein
LEEAERRKMVVTLKILAVMCIRSADGPNYAAGMGTSEWLE